MTPAEREDLIRQAEQAYGAALDSDLPDRYLRAVEALRRALTVTPIGHPDGVWCRLSLAAALETVFLHAAEPAALHDAVALLDEVAAALPSGDPERAVALANLSGALGRRYGYLGEPGDLTRAIDLVREVLAARPYDAALLANLCVLLTRKGDLDEAVDVGTRAVEFAPPGTVQRIGGLVNLGLARRHRYLLRGDVEDVDAAIDLLQEALDLTPGETSDRATILGSLVDAWRDRFGARGDRADIDRAVDAGRLLARLGPQFAQRAADFRTSLGICLRIRADAYDRPEDLTEALTHWRTAATSTGPVRMRMIAATLAALTQSERGRLAESVEDHATAIGLLPLLTWRGLDRTGREKLLGEYPGLAPAAAASAIAAGSPERAVELLEQGRAVLWRQLLDARTDLTALRQAHPDLATRLDQVRRRLDDPAQDADERRRLADEWEHLLTRVRGLDGFARFLLPTPYPELAEGAEGGPVVIVNVSQARCDALVVIGSGVRVIPLPALTWRDAADRTVACLTAVDRLVRTGDPTARQAVFACLEWMWDSFARDILTVLGHTGTPVGRWPRLWWSPTGPLSALPVHAAGYHDPEDGAGGESVLDRVVSSYTPSLGALRHARRPGGTPVAGRLLVTALPDAPPYLPAAGPVRHARTEVDLLVSGFPGPCDTLVGAEATTTEVLRALPEHPYVHFACHGGQNLSEPGSSALYLYDKPLRLADLVRLDLGAAELAVLSACETARGRVDLLDEASHLGAAFHLAGYRQVVATLWPVADQIAPEIAAAVCQDPRDAARVVHRCLRDLRRRYPDDPMTWASYLHLGR
ncbi:CHAT domain-containing protein [Plantactinospora sonchi]|uniref:CHAT domain-containing tetratricopeptide repeat protein n=1 Tax=Plantactinospora sonchi TaxID=1544735 RepID=A0ABU7RLU0_9ACTN